MTQNSWLDPAPGTVLPVYAGDTIEVCLTCANPEQKVVSFTAQVTGLGSWPHASKPLPVVPFESGTLALQITPSSEAQEGDYPFAVQLFCNGDPVEPNGTTALVIHIAPPKADAPQPEPETVKPVEEPVEKPAPAKPRAKASPPTPEAASGKTPPIVSPPEVESQVAAAMPIPAPAEPPAAPPAPAEPEPEPRRDEQEPQEPQEAPEPAPVIPAPVVRPEPRVVHIEPEPEPEVQEVDPTLTYSTDQVIANPADGTTLYVKPGETLLVRFSINNSETGVRTYVLQEDRSLSSDWIVLVRDQVNITPGGTGDLAFALKPPMSAEPANYPFTVSYGVLGKPLVPCYLTLQVQTSPATKLEVKRTGVTVGPIGRNVPFDLTVDTAGNSDTAYRIAAVQDAPEDSGRPGVVEVYETPTWIYLFDKEFENLASPSSGRQPPPVQHRLTITRKGIWWMGWRESHKLRVMTVPVTDRLNGGKAENAVELTAARWRLLPLPWFIMLPLVCLLVILLGSGASDLHVTNAVQGDDGAFYVVGSQPDQTKLDVHLAWSAPFYSVLKLDKIDQGHVSPVERSGENANDSAQVVEYGQAQKISYEIGSRFFGSSIKADVRLVPIRSQDMLRISVAGAAAVGVVGTDLAAEGRPALTTRDLTIMIPSSGASSISFANKTGTGKVNGQQIVMWTVRYPTGFKIQNFLTSQGDNQVINPASAMTAAISVDAESLPPNGEATWEMLTTDGTNQLLRIKLKAEQK